MAGPSRRNVIDVSIYVWQICSNMYGRLFESTFDGSMVGSGAPVFAVWSYVIAKQKNGQVELHPALLSAVLGEPLEVIDQSIQKLCAPDPLSRNTAEEGRRLIRQEAYTYRVVSAEVYAAIRSEEDRKEYNRRKQAEHRERRKLSKKSLTESNTSAVVSKNAFSDSDTKSDTDSDAERAREQPAKPDEADPGRETLCPLDLLKREAVIGALRELAEGLPAPLASLQSEAEEFLSYWTIGAGQGKKRSGWPRRLREHLRRRHLAGELKAPGAVSHEARNGIRRGYREQPETPQPAERSERSIKEMLKRIG